MKLGGEAWRLPRRIPSSDASAPLPFRRRFRAAPLLPPPLPRRSLFVAASVALSAVLKVLGDFGVAGTPGVPGAPEAPGASGVPAPPCPRRFLQGGGDCVGHSSEGVLTFWRFRFSVSVLDVSRFGRFDVSAF